MLAIDILIVTCIILATCCILCTAFENRLVAFEDKIIGKIKSKFEEL